MKKIAANIICLLALLTLPRIASADRFYVDSSAAPGGDGASWDTAFNYLQDALDATVAGRGDEIWIVDEISNLFCPSAWIV